MERYLPALAVALPLALACAGSWLAYRDAERAAAARLADMTRSMAEHAERAMAANEMVVHTLQRVRVRGTELGDLLVAIRERLPHIRTIGAHGEIALEPAYFSDFYRQLAKPREEAAFRIAFGDGRVLAQVGALDETYSATRAVGPFPLFVSASQSPRVVLAPWRHRTMILALIALPSAAALLCVSLLALRRTRRLQEEARSRRLAEERLRHSQKMDALGELTGGVAHDFTNLMAVISNAAHVMRERGADSSELAAIFRAVDGGTRLTRQLLTFARRQPLDPRQVELDGALAGMAELLKSTVGSGVSLGISVAPDTPPVWVDSAELEMSLINLAANARDAMERSGELEILARSAEPGEGPKPGTRYVIVSVSDSGPGIAPEILPRVFEPFFTTKPAGSGTGLGLAQVYGFCEQAGGGVRLESDIGVGTSVSLFLPAAAAMSEAVVRKRRGIMGSESARPA